MKHHDWKIILLNICIAIIALLVLVSIGLYIYAMIVYKDTPIAELPRWVFWLVK